MAVNLPKIECWWCGEEFDHPTGRGFPRRYCSRTCRQRAYEKRNGIKRGRWQPDDGGTRRWSE